eukprot:9800500-Ditylum_brightwellii.AAC.1
MSQVVPIYIAAGNYGRLQAIIYHSIHHVACGGKWGSDGERIGGDRMVQYSLRLFGSWKEKWQNLIFGCGWVSFPFGKKHKSGCLIQLERKRQWGSL